MDAHHFELTLLDGSVLPLSSLRGKKILLVNTASFCGLTPQYAQLEELHRNYGNLVQVIGLPCNDFGQQEPGSEEEIASFCSTKYNVTFPLTKKVGIKKDTHPLYKWLTNRELNGRIDSEVQWNFQKHLIDEFGELQAVFYPTTEVLSDEVLSANGISL